MDARPKRHPALGALLVLLLLVIPVSSYLLLFPTLPCPYCGGFGLREEPAQGAVVRWIRESDLIPKVCPVCRDRFKISRLKGWRGDWDSGPRIPVYRGPGDPGFWEVCETRILELGDAATDREDRDPPTGRSKRPDLIPALVGALQDDQTTVRNLAAIALVNMNLEELMPVLIAELNRPESEHQGLMALGISWLARTPGVRAQGVAALKAIFERKPSAPFDLRLTAEAALFQLGEPGPSDALVLSLTDLKYEEIAGKAILHYQRKDAVLLVIKELEAHAGTGWQPFLQLLSKLTGENLGRNAAPWREWFEKNKDRFPPQIQ